MLDKSFGGIKPLLKGPVQLIQRLNIIFKTVLFYHFKLVKVVPVYPAKESFKTHYLKWRNRVFKKSISTYNRILAQSLQDLIFLLIVFAATGNMPRVNISVNLALCC